MQQNRMPMRAGLSGSMLPNLSPNASIVRNDQSFVNADISMLDTA